MHCPHLKKFEKHVCVLADGAIIPSPGHREEFCTTGSYLACPMRNNFAEVARAFSYCI